MELGERGRHPEEREGWTKVREPPGGVGSCEQRGSHLGEREYRKKLREHPWDGRSYSRKSHLSLEGAPVE